MEMGIAGRPGIAIEVSESPFHAAGAVNGSVLFKMLADTGRLRSWGGTGALVVYSRTRA